MVHSIKKIEIINIVSGDSVIIGYIWDYDIKIAVCIKRIELKLTWIRSARCFIGGAWGCPDRGSRGHLIWHMHLYSISGDPFIVGEGVSTRFAPWEMSLHPLEHSQHWISGRQPPLCWCFYYIRWCYAECCRHTLEGL